MPAPSPRVESVNINRPLHCDQAVKEFTSDWGRANNDSRLVKYIALIFVTHEII